MNVIVFEEKAYYEHIVEITSFIKNEVIKPDWLKPAEAADMLNIKISTLKSYRDQGLITFSELSDRKFLYSRKSIENFIQKKIKRSFYE